MFFDTRARDAASVVSASAALHALNIAANATRTTPTYRKRMTGRGNDDGIIKQVCTQKSVA
jgi:hypothetical protein